MFKNLNEFNDAVYDILKDISCNNKFDPLYFEENFIRDTMDVIAFCSESKYITNLDIWHDGGGNVRTSQKGPVRITRDGLLFMETHSEATIKKLRRSLLITRLQFWITFAISIASFIKSFFF
jgi:hypothetical protein